MYISPVLLAHNLFVLFLLLALWAVVILIWVGIIAIGVALLWLLMAMVANAMNP
jgi:hypothetical protein